MCSGEAGLGEEPRQLGSQPVMIFQEGLSAWACSENGDIPPQESFSRRGRRFASGPSTPQFGKLGWGHRHGTLASLRRSPLPRSW